MTVYPILTVLQHLRGGTEQCPFRVWGTEPGFTSIFPCHQSTSEPASAAEASCIKTKMHASAISPCELALRPWRIFAGFCREPSKPNTTRGWRWICASRPLAKTACACSTQAAATAPSSRCGVPWMGRKMSTTLPVVGSCMQVHQRPRAWSSSKEVQRPRQLPHQPPSPSADRRDSLPGGCAVAQTALMSCS